MLTYRLYVLGTNGRIEAVTKIVEASDEAAVVAAERLRHSSWSELWNCGRLVKVFDEDVRPGAAEAG